MRKHQVVPVLVSALALIASPVQAAGLTSGRIDDTRADAIRAASDAQDVANLASYEDRIVVFPPTPPVAIPVGPMTLPALAPQGVEIALGGGDQELIGLFVLGGLVGLPALIGGGGGGGLFTPPTGTTPGTPSGPTEITPPPPPPPPAVPEPATWAMLLMGFAAIGRAARRSRIDGHSQAMAGRSATA